MKTTRSGRIVPDASAVPEVTFPIPAIARSAFQLAQNQYAQQLNALAQQAVESLGLDPKAYAYRCDFDRGVIVRGEKLPLDNAPDNGTTN